MKRCRGLLTYIFARSDGGNSDGRCRRPARPLPYVGPKRRPPSSYRRTKGRQRRPRRQPAEHLLRPTSPRLRFIGRPKMGRAGRARSLHLRPVRRSAIKVENAPFRGGEIPFGRHSGFRCRPCGKRPLFPFVRARRGSLLPTIRDRTARTARNGTDRAKRTLRNKYFVLCHKLTLMHCSFAS